MLKEIFLFTTGEGPSAETKITIRQRNTVEDTWLTTLMGTDTRKRGAAYPTFSPSDFMLVCEYCGCTLLCANGDLKISAVLKMLIS